jgi:hypothetical protein
LGFGNKLAVENIVNRVVLIFRMLNFLIGLNFREQAGKVQPLRFPMVNRIARIQEIGLTDNLVQ